MAGEGVRVGKVEVEVGTSTVDLRFIHAGRAASGAAVDKGEARMEVLCVERCLERREEEEEAEVTADVADGNVDLLLLPSVV